MAEIHGEEAIRGKVVMHLCDNPPCVNVDHLAIATQKDNVRDMMDKGRHVVVRAGRKGEAHHAGKLTDEKVSEIRLRLSQGEKRQALADEFGVTYWTIRDIQIMRIWAHVT